MENDMNAYIIDYKRPDGRTNFSTVHADTEAEAVHIFQNRGIDGWSGYNYNEYTITAITKR